MFNILIIVLSIAVALYYYDIIVKVVQDEKRGTNVYTGIRLIIPFGFWFFPPKKKMKQYKDLEANITNINKTKKSKDEEK